MSTMKRNTALAGAVALALAGGVASAAPQYDLNGGAGFTIDNAAGIASGTGLVSGFSASTAATNAQSYAASGTTVSTMTGSDAANGFVMKQVEDGSGNKYIQTMVFQDTGSGESANFAYEANVSSFRNSDAINAGGSTSNGNGGNNGGIAAKMIIQEDPEQFAMNAAITNGGFTGSPDATTFGATNVVVNQELGAVGADAHQLFAMNIQTNGTANWTDGSLTILQDGDGAEMADFGHTVLAGSYLAAADLGTLAINHSGTSTTDTLDATGTTYGAVSATWISSTVPVGGAYNDFSDPNSAANSAGFGLLVYRGYTDAATATGGLGTGTMADPAFQQNAAGAEISGFTLSADGGLFDGSVTSQADLNTAFNTPTGVATGAVSDQFTAVDSGFNTSPF